MWIEFVDTLYIEETHGKSEEKQYKTGFSENSESSILFFLSLWDRMCSFREDLSSLSFLLIPVNFLFFSLHLIFIQGYDCNPMLFTYNASQGKLSLVSKLDIPQEKEAGTIRFECTFVYFMLFLSMHFNHLLTLETWKCCLLWAAQFSDRRCKIY